MKIRSEDVDGDVYVDIILTPEELQSIENREMIEGVMYAKSKKWYLGLFLEGKWDYEEEVEGE